MTSNEEWKPVAGYPKYSVSNLGRVKGIYGRLLTPTYRKSRRRVDLYKRVAVSRNGKWDTKKIATLVALTWIGPRPGNYTVDHIDRNPINDKVTNLRWASASTQSQNQAKHTNRQYASKFKGVTKHLHKWRAKIYNRNTKRSRHLGLFSTEEEAARRYDEVAKIYFPDGVLNFPNEQQ